MPASFPLILASASPRRRDLLTEAGFVFETRLPDEDVEGDQLPNELPEEYVQRLAFLKANNVACRIKQGIILGADTIVLCGGSILEKPIDRADAQNMLRQLCGQVHNVLSGMCLIKKSVDQEPTVFRATETTRLLMRAISEDELEKYLDTELWKGKAGAFGYQDGIDWITILEGSESNVVGLPMELFQMMYRSCEGIR